MQNLEMDAEQTEDIIAVAQKITKYPYKSRWHSESPESKGIMGDLRDAQGGNKKQKKNHEEQHIRYNKESLL